MRKIVGYLCTLVMVISGCGTIHEKPQVVRDDGLTIAQFCSNFVEKIGRQETGIISSVFDRSTFLKNIFSTVPLNPQEKNAFKVGFESALDGVFLDMEQSMFFFGSWYVQSIKDNGTRGKCVLQSGMVDLGVSIIEFYVTNRGSIKISNWFDHTQGVLATDRVRTTLLDFYQHGKSAISEEQKKLGYQNMAAFAKALQKRDIDKALDYYKALPHQMKKNGMNALSIVSLSTFVGRRYEESVEILLDIPEYSARPFIVIDYLLEKKQFDQIHDILDNLEESIGESSVIEILRSSIFYAQGQTEKSWKHALKSIDIDNSYEASYWHVFSQFVDQRSYEDAILVLDILYKAWGYDFTRATFENEPLYQDLVKTPEFDQWIKRL